MLLTHKSYLFALVALVIMQPMYVYAEYPEKPITLIVGFRAGGAADRIARTLAKIVSKNLSYPMVVVNKPGSGARIAVKYTKNAPPDGYTLTLTADQPFTFAPLYEKNYPVTIDDFKYIVAVTKAQTAFVTSTNRSWHSFDEMIAYGKSHGNHLIYASLYPIDRLIMQVVSAHTGLEIDPIIVKGGRDSMRAVLTERVDFGYSGGIHSKHAINGKIRVLASMRAERLLASPKVPTLRELEFPVDYSPITLIATGKGVPDAIIKQLATLFQTAVKDEKFEKLLNGLYFPKYFLGPENLEQKIRAQAKIYEHMLRQAKISIIR